MELGFMAVRFPSMVEVCFIILPYRGEGETEGRLTLPGTAGEIASRQLQSVPYR